MKRLGVLVAVFVLLLTGRADAATGYVTRDDFANAIDWTNGGTDLGSTLTNVTNLTGATGDKINQWTNQYGLQMSNWNYNSQDLVGCCMIQYWRFNSNSAWHAWQGWWQGVYNANVGPRVHFGNTGTPLE